MLIKYYISLPLNRLNLLIINNNNSIHLKTASSEQVLTPNADAATHYTRRRNKLIRFKTNHYFRIMSGRHCSLS